VLWSLDTQAGGTPALQDPTKFWMTDINGSVVGVCNAQGFPMEWQRYDGYGKTDVLSSNGTPEAQSALGNRLGFQGRTAFPEFGLQYFRNRFYDPGLGRFISRDPLGLAAGMNMYAAFDDNPVFNTDPLGLDPETMIGRLSDELEDGRRGTAGKAWTLAKLFGYSLWNTMSAGALEREDALQADVTKGKVRRGTVTYIEKRLQNVAESTTEVAAVASGNKWVRAAYTTGKAVDNALKGNYQTVNVPGGGKTAGIPKTIKVPKGTGEALEDIADAALQTISEDQKQGGGDEEEETADDRKLAKEDATRSMEREPLDDCDGYWKSKEPEQLRRGKEAHENEVIRPGEKAEVPTPSGRRMDRYDETTRHIREIKPNNPRGLREGEKQVEEYKQEMEEVTGEKHSTEITPYGKD